MTDLRKLLALNMKIYRNELGLSQSRLADKVNTASNYIALIETGKKFPSTRMLERIAEALDVDTTALFSLKLVHLETKQRVKEKILADIGEILSSRLNELD
ncbi:MAG: helix-turn-helix domain-containing protein [Treponema sp.]|jgi:transcriptional regulator with XRE-family HTH domain|nr:helix-turn-helix domain-containing protein [Treponema sp.]